jgi:hypothetical protein
MTPPPSPPIPHSPFPPIPATLRTILECLRLQPWSNCRPPTYPHTNWRRPTTTKSVPVHLHPSPPSPPPPPIMTLTHDFLLATKTKLVFFVCVCVWRVCVWGGGGYKENLQNFLCPCTRKYGYNIPHSSRKRPQRSLCDSKGHPSPPPPPPIPATLITKVSRLHLRMALDRVPTAIP